MYCTGDDKKNKMAIHGVADLISPRQSGSKLTFDLYISYDFSNILTVFVFLTFDVTYHLGTGLQYMVK